MKRTFLLAILFSIVFIACKSGGGKSSSKVRLPEVADTVKDLNQLPRVFAVYGLPDTSTRAGLLWVKIIDAIKKDSATGKRTITTDTLWAIPKQVTDTLIDAKTLKPIYDTANGRWAIVTIDAFDRQISKDSVRFWGLEGISLDSMTTRGFWKKRNR